mmetsp:Transcript_12547/g.36360  ORF Transcript_12547/g.36360 Transcript_12547/m.36360 type:complete len:348 (-) Transcript_12547:58-1101(-)
MARVRFALAEVPKAAWMAMAQTTTSITSKRRHRYQKSGDPRSVRELTILAQALSRAMSLVCVREPRVFLLLATRLMAAAAAGFPAAARTSRSAIHARRSRADRTLRRMCSVTSSTAPRLTCMAMVRPEEVRMCILVVDLSMATPQHLRSRVMGSWSDVTIEVMVRRKIVVYWYVGQNTPLRRRTVSAQFVSLYTSASSTAILMSNQQMQQGKNPQVSLWCLWPSQTGSSAQDSGDRKCWSRCRSILSATTRSRTVSSPISTSSSWLISSAWSLTEWASSAAITLPRTRPISAASSAPRSAASSPSLASSRPLRQVRRLHISSRHQETFRPLPVRPPFHPHTATSPVN